MEIYAGANTDDMPKLDLFMANFGFQIIQTDAEIMKEAACER